MVKESLAIISESLEDIQSLLVQWQSDAVVQAYELLKGGYSATNYKVTLVDQQTLVIKACNGYGIHAVEQQASIAAYLHDHGFGHCCHPARLLAATTDSTFTSLIHGNPVILVNYINGKGGDVLIENGILTLALAVERIAASLSSMHCTALVDGHGLRSYQQDGICFLGRHLTGEYHELFSTHADRTIREHSFVTCYLSRYQAMLDTLQQSAGMRHAVLHGDPFIDNVLFSPADGQLLGFVDFEDACVGPAVLDVACCIVGKPHIHADKHMYMTTVLGNCFDERCHLDASAMTSFLASYYTSLLNTETSAGQRKVIAQELKLLAPIMRCVILLNAR